MATAADGPQSLIPGLEEEAALLCLARVPRAYHKVRGAVLSPWIDNLHVTPASWPLSLESQLSLMRFPHRKAVGGWP